MKKRVLSALLVLCMACSMVSTVWAANEQATPETADKPASVLLDDSQSAPVTNAPAQDQDVAEGLTAPEDEESGQKSDVDTPDASQPEQAESTGTPVDGGVEYTAALEQDGQALNVIVAAPEGAFDEGVEPKLSVSAIEDEAQTDGIAAKLDEYGLTYDGFAALDISFKNEAGEEIEPKVPVTVRIELPQTIVDSGIDLNTLAVQHLEEDENGDVKNVTEVATLDNGITLSEEAAAAANEAAGVAPMSDLPAEEATAGDAAATPAAVAEFEVDGFSSFVITWTDSGNDAQINVVIRDIDTRQEIDIPGFDSSYWNNKLRNEETITVQDIVSHLETGEYEYANSATYTVRNGQEQQFSSVRARRTREESISKRYYFYFNGSNDYVRVLDSDATIYLYYTKSDSGEVPGGDQGGTTVTNATVTTSKTAVLKDDDSGYYDLTLSISGDRGSSSKKQKVDVLFILDESNSMMESWSGNTRLAHAKDAIEHITGYGNNNGLSDNTNLDVQYALVGFYGGASNRRNPYKDATVLQNWTSSADTLCNSTPGWLDDERDEGGTNYEAGIRTGKEVLAASEHRSDALTVVIFITDGNPGYYYDNDGKTAGTGNPGNSYNSTALSNAVSQLKTLDTDYFYLVGVTNNISTRVFQQMENAVDVPYSNKDSISANSPQDLLKAFEDIQEQITFFAATDVTITDPLSKYADIVLNADEKAKFTVTVTRTELKDKEGKVTSEAKTWEEKVTAGEEVKFQDRAGNDVTVTPAYDADTKTITLTFPHSTGDTPGYELEPGYTYSISTVITPSETAKNLGMDRDAAKQTPDTGTGTHADAEEQGFWSNDNDNAKVTFTANGEPGSENFPRPVIQVPEKTTVDLTLKKTFVGLTDAEVNYLIFREDGFGWDINYCQPDLREGTEEKNGKEITYATYMADEDAVKGITLPDGTEVTGGGDFRITAKQFLETGDNGLTQIAGITDPASGYTNNSTGASLKKVDGNWVYSVTLQVPKAEDGYFYTVFEQHGEVPGYAKLDDSNVVYTITYNDGTSTGTGKFIDNAENNVYVDMDTEVSPVDVTVNGKEYTIDGEEAAINQGVLQKLEIADDTTIAFENHYTGNLKVSKTVSGISDKDLKLKELADKTFTITLQPSENIANLELLNGRTINYTITHTDSTTTTGSAVMDKDKSCAIQVGLKYGDTITFQEIPAIQYTVTENAPATTGGYDIGSYTWIEAEYSETSENFGDPQKDEDHWNHNGLSEPDRRYYTTIGTDNAGDHILSVDSKIGDSRPVQTLQITNEYVEYKSLTIEKDITGTLAIPTDRFTFTITGATGITESDIEKIGDDTSKITVTVADGTITANLGKGDSITINKLTDTHKLTISEASGDYTPIIDLTGVDGYVEGNPDENTESQHSGFTVSGNQVTVTVGSVTDDVGNGTSLGTVKYNNQKNVTPPTGLESNHTTPYTLMVTAAGIAGLALIGGIVVRRRRRRME